ncbi:MAG: hypothetical protein AAGB14_00305 [Verrucomicrobiota bacterium]
MANHTTSSDIDAFLKSADKESGRTALGLNGKLAFDTGENISGDHAMLESDFGKFFIALASLTFTPWSTLDPHDRNGGRIMLHAQSGATVSFPGGSVIDALTGGTLSEITEHDGFVVLEYGVSGWIANRGLRGSVSSAAPALSPSRLGLFHVNSMAKVIYVSVGTSSAADWIPFATTLGHPIAWNATQGKFQKLVVSGGAGSETITYADL